MELDLPVRFPGGTGRSSGVGDVTHGRQAPDLCKPFCHCRAYFLETSDTLDPVPQEGEGFNVGKAGE
jgi:hypothetical protein